MTVLFGLVAACSNFGILYLFDNKTEPSCLKLTPSIVNGMLIFQGPVVQSIVSLTSSLRGQLVKCFTTL